jgi:signal transduction histidine kinase
MREERATSDPSSLPRDFERLCAGDSGQPVRRGARGHRRTSKVVVCVSLAESPRHPGDWTPEDRSYVAISVADSGEGILPENLERAFEPLFSTRFAGRGLGPTTVGGLPRDHNGGRWSLLRGW